MIERFKISNSTGNRKTFIAIKVFDRFTSESFSFICLLFVLDLEIKVNWHDLRSLQISYLVVTDKISRGFHTDTQSKTKQKIEKAKSLCRGI